MRFFEREPERRRNEQRPIKPEDPSYQAMKQAIKDGKNPEVELLARQAAIEARAEERKMTDPIPRPDTKELTGASGDTLENVAWSAGNLKTAADRDIEATDKIKEGE